MEVWQGKVKKHRNERKPLPGRVAGLIRKYSGQVKPCNFP
jgi:hypothetical protein